MDCDKISNMKRQKYDILFWLIFAAGVAADQITKYMVKINMDYLQSIPIIPDVFNLTYILNNGAAWSILEGYRWFFVVLGIIVLIAILIFRQRTCRHDWVMNIALAFICVGALGNLIDRALYGAVVDFFSFVLINFPIFNVADCFITIGVIIMIWHWLITPLIIKSKADKDG